ncbi:MAG: TVP38/TMEM64 family protein [Anaerolineales bacterium]|nr:TVP38/TMEM64 family protein [Anaerolineales bacterium]
MAARTKRAETAKRTAAILLGLAVAGLALTAAVRLLPLQAWLEAFNRRVADAGPEGLVFFVLAYAAATVLFVPGSVLTVGAGFAFGLLWGTAAVSAGSTLGAGLAFLVSRHLARERISSMAKRNARFGAVDRAVGREGWKIILLLRLSPLIPFNLSNYLYGLTAVSFRHYLAASWLGMLPGTLLYVYLGVAGRTGLEAAAAPANGHDWLRTAFLAAGLAATITVTWFVSRVARKALNRNAAADAPPTGAQRP